MPGNQIFPTLKSLKNKNTSRSLMSALRVLGWRNFKGNMQLLFTKHSRMKEFHLKSASRSIP